MRKNDEFELPQRQNIQCIDREECKELGGEHELGELPGEKGY